MNRLMMWVLLAIIMLLGVVWVTSDQLTRIVIMIILGFTVMSAIAMLLVMASARRSASSQDPSPARYRDDHYLPDYGHGYPPIIMLGGPQQAYPGLPGPSEQYPPEQHYYESPQSGEQQRPPFIELDDESW